MNMDWNNLQNTVSNLTLYDLKAGVRKVQNGMLSQHSLHTAHELTNSSRHELHRNGSQGSGSDKQRALGRFFVHDAGDRKWHLQLV